MAKDKKLKKSKSSSAVSESKPTAAAAAVVTKPVKKSDVKSTTKETKKSSKTITKSKSKKESESDEEEDDDDMDIESNADLEEEEEEEGSDEEEEVEGENEGKSELENEESDDDEMEEEEEEEGSDDEDMEDEKKSKKTKKTSSDDSETKAVSESKKSKDKSKDKESKDVKDIKDNQKSDSKSNSKSQCLTDLTFDKLGLHDNLLKGLTDAGFSKQFEIQARSIPHLLKGEDVLGSAKTGSGKTLAFLVPMIDTLVKTKFIQKNGTGLLVIAPTRELADQIYSVAREIMKYLSQTHGVVLGGMNRREEAKKLERGVNVLVATPGRLLDHLQNTKGFVYHNLISLVLDEADRILEIGFEEEMHAILRLLPAQRQTALFSATQTKKVADLVRLSMKRPVFIEVKSDDNLATREGLQQGYVVCEADKRFLLLYTFLKREYLVNKSKNIDKKIIVFMSSKHAVKYFTSLLNYIDLQCDCIHGDKKQTQRTSVFQQFSVATRGVLLATNVAARGLDIPKVDWIVQFDPPDDPREYIHRVGRTARGANGIGKALLFLLPSELGFLRYLKKSGVEPDQFVFPENKIANIQVQLERIIEKNFHLHRESRDAYKSYIHAYAAHSLKDCFEVEKLDLAKVAKSFGFSAPPKVELAIKHRVKKGGDKKKAAAMIKNRDSEGSNSIINPHDRFSAHNPYGKRERGDKRQFMK